jgi:hypothetical protein
MVLAFLKNRWFLLSMVFACWGLVASFFAGFYWIQYTDIRDRIGGALVTVNVGVDYGNGSRFWSNETKALTGQTLFDVTKQVANVTYQVGPWGTEVLSIDGVSKQGSFGWTYWILNSTSSQWSIVWENADGYLVADKETFMWYYQEAFNPPPP